MGGIVLSGFAGMIPFIAEYIEAKTNVSTMQGNPWQLVRVTPEQQQVLCAGGKRVCGGDWFGRKREMMVRVVVRADEAFDEERAE